MLRNHLLFVYKPFILQMIKKLTILLLILQPLIAKCDFADYWTVSINDSIIYNSSEDDSAYFKTVIIDISKLQLKNSDTLKINYLTDTPCPDCKYSLLILDEDKNKILYKDKMGFDENKPLSNPSAFIRRTNSFGEILLLTKDLEQLKNKGQLAVYFSISKWRYLREIIKFK